eukprot:scaffold52669_cov40-Cyclotella_meneghiniana.AAC.10
MVDEFHLVAEVARSGYWDNDEITPNTHPTVCNCGAFAAQKKHYIELGGLPLNLKEDVCDVVDWNVFLASVPATRMTEITKAIENKNVEDVVVGYLDKLFPNRHSGDHRKGPRAPWVNDKSCMTHHLFSGDNKSTTANVNHCLHCLVNLCPDCWDKFHGPKKTYNDIIQEHLPACVPVGESTKTIAQLARRCVKVVKSDNVMNIQIPEHLPGESSWCATCGDSTHTIFQSASHYVSTVKPDNDVNIHIPEHLPGVPLGDSTHTIAQLASSCVNVVKPDNDVSIQKLSGKPYTEMAQLASRCVADDL